MNEERHPMICPAELSGTLDNSLRRLFQNPARILKPFIREGMTVLDLGCGPGFFTIEIARIVSDSGRVIAADLQPKMLDKVATKIGGTEFEKRISLHQCGDNTIGVEGKVDFVLAFWMVHEVPDPEKMFDELYSIVKPGGTVYIIEPIFHVTKDAFAKMVQISLDSGFTVTERPKIIASRAIILKKN